MSLLRKLFNRDALSEKNSSLWPALAKSWAGRTQEMPSEAAATNKVRPMNWAEKKLFGSTVQGATYPWGTIALNRDNIERDNVNLDDLLVHELTHIGQGQREGIFGAYRKGGSKDLPDYEQEAFDAEQKRKVRRTDIHLGK